MLIEYYALIAAGDVSDLLRVTIGVEGRRTEAPLIGLVASQQ
jgi:hypothetical protein